MRFLKLLCIICAILIALSLSACEEQGSPSAGELSNNSVVSTDFDPNFHDPKPVPVPVPAPEQEKLYVNSLTNLLTVKEADLNKMPVAVVLNNSVDARSAHSGLVSADIVFESESQNGETALLAVYKVAPAGMNIGPTTSAIELFVDLCQAYKFKLASDRIESEHAEPYLNEYNLERLKIEDDNFLKILNNGLTGLSKRYTDGDKLNVAVAQNGYTLPENTAPIWMFVDNRVPASDPAVKVAVKFNESASTEFYYDEAKKVYNRGMDGVPFAEYNTNLIDSYKNVIVLKMPSEKYPHCDHYKFKFDNGGEGYYATDGKYEKITWERNSSGSGIYFKDGNGQLLNMSSGKTYVCFVRDSVEDSFKAE